MVTCADYRLGRRLLALKTQIQDKDLSPEKRREIEIEIAELEKSLGMD
ncbi:MAG: hypothetical protein PVG03_18225 [Desulfarculaceae bacterium]